MTDVHSYRGLLVWQNGIALVTDIHQATKTFPREEVYGLSTQMRRCAISIPSNIAEGHGHSTRKAYLRCRDIAVGSLYELQTQLIIARNVKILASEDFVALEARSRELERMLSALIRSLRRKPKR